MTPRLKTWIWILAILGAIFLCFALFPEINSGQVGRRAMASNDVHNLVAALKSYQAEYGVPLTGTPREMMAVLRGKNPHRIVFFEGISTRFNESGEFIDPWKTPYRFGTNDAGFAWAYSCGKNKRDEGGAPGTDDIVSWR